MDKSSEFRFITLLDLTWLVRLISWIWGIGMRGDFNCLWRRQQTFQGNLTPSLTVPALFENKAFNKGWNKFQSEDRKKCLHISSLSRRKNYQPSGSPSTKFLPRGEFLIAFGGNWHSPCCELIQHSVSWDSIIVIGSAGICWVRLSFFCKIYNYNSNNWYKVYCDWHSRNLLGSPLFICNAMPWLLTTFLLLLYNILLLLFPRV